MTDSIVIIGDILDSTELSNSEHWPGFERSIDQLNGDCAEHLEIPLAIYAGDSFGGTAKTLAGAAGLILRLFESLLPLQSRILLIENTITYGLDKGTFLQLEGPALWESEKRLPELKKKREFFMASLRDGGKAELVTHFLNLLLPLKVAWTPRQREIIKTWEASRTQKEAAAKLGVSPQYVSRELIDARLSTIRRSEEYIIRKLKS